MSPLVTLTIKNIDSYLWKLFSVLSRDVASTILNGAVHLRVFVFCFGQDVKSASVEMRWSTTAGIRFCLFIKVRLFYSRKWWSCHCLIKHHAVIDAWHSEGIAPHIHNLGTGYIWVVSFMPRPPLYGAARCQGVTNNLVCFQGSRLFFVWARV